MKTREVRLANLMEPTRCVPPFKLSRLVRVVVDEGGYIEQY
jgi:hypothetical protein